MLSPKKAELMCRESSSGMINLRREVDHGYTLRMQYGLSSLVNQQWMMEVQEESSSQVCVKCKFSYLFQIATIVPADQVSFFSTTLSPHPTFHTSHLVSFEYLNYLH